MSQQPKMCRIAGNAQKVLSQLDAQSPELAQMLVGALAVMIQSGNRRVTFDFHRDDSAEFIDVTVSEDSLTIKRGCHETQQNHKAHKANKKRDRLKLPDNLANAKPQARDAGTDERRQAEGPGCVETAER